VLVFHRFLFVTAVPQGRTYNAEYVTTSLIPQLEEKIRKTRPVLGLRGTKLHWDNARPHVAEATRTLLGTKGVHLLPHPPYSPDLAPSDFYLFGTAKTQIRGQRFTSSDEIVAKMEKILEEIQKDELLRVYNTWLKRLEWVARNGGEYYKNTH